MSSLYDDSSLNHNKKLNLFIRGLLLEIVCTDSEKKNNHHSKMLLTLPRILTNNKMYDNFEIIITYEYQ